MLCQGRHRLLSKCGVGLRNSRRCLARLLAGLLRHRLELFARNTGGLQLLRRAQTRYDSRSSASAPLADRRGRVLAARCADRFEKRKKIAIYKDTTSLHAIASQLLKVLIEEVCAIEDPGHKACRPSVDYLRAAEARYPDGDKHHVAELLRQPDRRHGARRRRAHHARGRQDKTGLRCRSA